MSKVVAGITMSVDGYITGPNDGPGCGLGDGGERLHYWVFGGPWSYDSPGRGEPTGVDKVWLEEVLGANGAVVTGRGTYEAAGHWGDKNPWGIPVFVVTHHPQEQPPGDEFVFVGGCHRDGLEPALITVLGNLGGDALRDGLPDQREIRGDLCLHRIYPRGETHPAVTIGGVREGRVFGRAREAFREGTNFRQKSYK